MADMGDVATWSGVGVSVVFSAAALVVSVISLRHARRAADAAERQATAAEQALPPAPPSVAWRIEHVNDQFLIRNIGTAPATGVKIESRGSWVANLDYDDVQAGGSVTFIMSPSLAKSAPGEMWVSWDGQADPVPVPMPPRG